MQPSGREMQGGGGGGQDDFFDQMLSTLPAAWSELGSGKSPWELPAGASEDAAFDESALLASRLRHHQIGGGGDKPVMLHLSDLHGLAAGVEDGGAAGFLPLPLFTDRAREDMDATFKSPNAVVRCLLILLRSACLLQRFHFAPSLTWFWGFAGRRPDTVQRIRSRRDAWCRRCAAAVRAGTPAKNQCPHHVHQDDCTLNYSAITLLLHSWRKQLAKILEFLFHF
jgi:hypothetical protein